MKEHALVAITELAMEPSRVISTCALISFFAGKRGRCKPDEWILQASNAQG